MQTHGIEIPYTTHAQKVGGICKRSTFICALNWLHTIDYIIHGGQVYRRMLCTFAQLTLTSSPAYFNRPKSVWVEVFIELNLIRQRPYEARAHFLSLALGKLRLCSANHRPGYFSSLTCDWLSIVWAYSEQETENGPRSSN